uniref:Matrix metalloproteinase-25 n=3 Tax=Lygus hesperus TaxID=30085 RepID=A0A146KPQ8_LYGHE
MLVLTLFAVYLTTPVLMKSVPAPSPLIQQAPQSIDFLKKYGYLTGTSGGVLEALYTKESVEGAIKEAQRFGGIKETGSLNEETIKLFSSKRCGLPDIIKNVTSFAGSRPSGEDVIHHGDNHHHHHHHSSHHYNHYHHDHTHHREKRFVLNENSWRRRHLKFYISSWSQSLSQSEVVGELERTLKIWGQYGNLQFSRTTDPREAEISVGFYRGQHGDTNPFDGRGNVLAHAFFPDSRDGRGLAGDVHFDDDESWSVGRANDPMTDTVDFTSVALHELGHSLGLHHSPVQGSVMNPYYRGKSILGDDDVQAMYELYVKKSMDDYDETIRSDAEEREDEAKRRYDEERRKWEEKRREIEKRRLELEERKRLDDEREERRRYEEEKKKRLEEVERKRLEDEREERRRYEENNKRLEVLERKRLEDEREERKRYEEERKKRLEEDERKRLEVEREERRRYEDERRKWMKDQSAGMPPKSGGTTFEGDDEYVETHKGHDPTHRIPPTQNPHDLYPPMNPSGKSDGCAGGFSAATYLRGELFLLKRNMLWRLSRPGAVQEKYPVEVRRFFHLLPEEVNPIDAMYERDQDSSLIIFSGRKYWVFDGHKISGSRNLQDYGLPQDVERIDAVTSRNGQVLIFSGNRYWSQNDTSLETPVQRQPARPISALRGLPDRLDAALTYNDVTYFFKDDKFWTMDRNSNEAVLHNSPASDYWIGC